MSPARFMMSVMLRNYTFSNLGRSKIFVLITFIYVDWYIHTRYNENQRPSIILAVT